MHPQPAPTSRIERFLVQEAPPTPFLVVDLDVVAERYHELVTALPEATVYYAVKANPSREIVQLLADLGACFDVASPAEVDLCISCGVDPERLSFGNTVKKVSAIVAAWSKGVRQFAFDSDEELDKLMAHAPGATVFCRILCDPSGADYPLTRKFGCRAEHASQMLRRAARAGMAVGVSFHVGSQQHDPRAWDRALADVADIFAELRADGVDPVLVNIGGGLPGHYQDPLPATEHYGEMIGQALRRRLGPELPPLVIAEPGRYLVADAGLLRTEVVLATTKDPAEQHRWLYLDAGLFSGLIETLDNAIRYPLRTSRDHEHGPRTQVVLAGPTCDSLDVLYEHAGYELPASLCAGDTVDFLGTGAYVASLGRLGFNGFAPVANYYVGEGGSS